MVSELKRCCTCKGDKSEEYFTPGEWKKSSTKRCRDCVKAKNQATQSKNGEARSAYQKKYYADNKEKLLVQNSTRWAANKDRYSIRSKQWYAENKDRLNKERSDNKDEYTYKSWVHRLKRVYGITPEDYDQMLSDQSGECAICGTNDPGNVGSPTAARKVFAVDHCHSSGEVRGLLCHRCNTGLGLFSDNVDSLLRAAEYIKGTNLTTQSVKD